MNESRTLLLAPLLALILGGPAAGQDTPKAPLFKKLGTHHFPVTVRLNVR